MSTPPARQRDKRPSQYELDTDELVAIGRELNTASPSVLAAEFYRRKAVAPNPAALDVAELILRGERA